jgi:hypothetical protein
MRIGVVDPAVVVLVAVPVGLVVGLVSWSWRRRTGRVEADGWVDGALAAALVGVLLATFTPLGRFGDTAGRTPDVQLIPWERLDGAPVEFAVINLFLLAPVAFLLVLRGRRANLGVVVLTCIGLSVTIETLQLLHPLRGTNVDDVLLNGIGAVVGALLGGLARLARPTTRQHRATRRAGSGRRAAPRTPAAG